MTIPTAPPSRLETWLATTDGFNLAAVILFAFVGLCLACWVVSKVTRVDRQQESTEAAINPSRRANSGRKSGRVSQ